jgi:hypothetical protein
MRLSTDQKGSIAELAIAKAAVARGIVVYRPLSDGERYDMIFDFGGVLPRPRPLLLSSGRSDRGPDAGAPPDRPER